MHDDHDDFSSLVIGCDELMMDHPCACCHDVESEGSKDHIKDITGPQQAFDGRRVSWCHVLSVTNDGHDA